MLALLLVALSVGLDNFGAATALGVSGTSSAIRVRVAVVFGVFEAGMPVIGILLGHAATGAVGTHANLVAGLLLCGVGAASIVQELLGREAPARPTTMRRTIVLGAVLSIDNLAVGFALGDRRISIVLAALVIGVVSVALTLLGFELGERLGRRLGERSELVAGALLIGVGVAIATGVL